MAKLIVLALTCTALVAFASAHTTIEEETPDSRVQCSLQIQRASFNQCQWYLLQGHDSWYGQVSPGQQQEGVKWCCQEFQSVDQQCRCEAVMEVLRQAMRQPQQQGHYGGSLGSQQMKQMKQKAQKLPNKCNFQTRQCQITDENPRGSQQCQHIRKRRFTQCQNYIQRQSGSSGTLLMSINRRGQQPQSLEQCCSELQNYEEECQCEAMKEVYRQAQQMRQQGSQQRGRRGGRPQTQELQYIVQNLRNQCNLHVQQCRIPTAMF